MEHPRCQNNLVNTLSPARPKRPWLASWRPCIAERFSAENGKGGPSDVLRYINRLRTTCPGRAAPPRRTKRESWASNSRPRTSVSPRDPRYPDKGRRGRSLSGSTAVDCRFPIVGDSCRVPFLGFGAHADRGI